MAAKLQGDKAATQSSIRVAADVWEFQAKSGSSGYCHLFLRFLGKIAVQEKYLGKRLEVPDILLPDIRGLLIHGTL